MLLYAPLKGVMARLNPAAAALLRDVTAGEVFDLTEEERHVLDALAGAGVVNGPPDLPLTVYEHEEFAPVCVTLYLTDACNLRCLYCYAWGGDNPKPVTIPVEAARAGIDFAAANAARTQARAFAVNFHGAGEPTIAWPLYRELVAYARRKGKELGVDPSFTTCTNGVMSARRAHWIAENTQAANISVDGLPAAHDLLRPKRNGAGSFADVERTLRIFDEHDFFYAIRATITEHNAHTMAEMVEYFCQNFRAAEMQFDPLMFSGRCFTSGCMAPAEDAYVREFVRASEVAQTHSRELGFSTISLSGLKTFDCCAVAEGFTVTHDGLVTSCFESCGLDRPFPDVFMYGCYDFDRHAFVFDHEKLRRLRRRHVHNLAFCRDCFCKYMCSGDCPMHSLKLGYNMERGGRCAVTQAIAKHRLAMRVLRSREIPHLPYTCVGAESTPPDFSLRSVTGNRRAGTPELSGLRQLRVKEVLYMKPPPPDQAARDLVSSGNVLYRQLQFDRALAKYGQAIEKDARYAPAHANRGLALHKVGRLDDAMAALRKAIELEGGNAAFRLNLGKVLVAAGQLDAAVEEFDEALRLDPSMASAAYNRAWVLAEKGEFDRVAEAVRVILAMSTPPPGTGMLAAIAGVCRGETGSAAFEDAGLPASWKWLGALNRCLATGGLEDVPEGARPTLCGALWAISAEQHSLARERLAVVAEAAPRSPLPDWLAAMSWQVEGNKQRADEAMTKAVRLMPQLCAAAWVEPAGLFVDGELVGCTPLVLPLLPGRHSVRAVRSGHDGPEILETTLTLQGGESRSLEFDGLVPGPAPVPQEAGENAGPSVSPPR